MKIRHFIHKQLDCFHFTNNQSQNWILSHAQNLIGGWRLQLLFQGPGVQGLQIDPARWTSKETIWGLHGTDNNSLVKDVWPFGNVAKHRLHQLFEKLWGTNLAYFGCQAIFCDSKCLTNNVWSFGQGLKNRLLWLMDDSGPPWASLCVERTKRTKTLRWYHYEHNYSLPGV